VPVQLQKLEAAVIQTSVDAELNLPAVQGSDEPLSGPAAVVLCGLLGKVGITAFLSPDPEVYQSAKGEPCREYTAQNIAVYPETNVRTRLQAVWLHVHVLTRCIRSHFPCTGHLAMRAIWKVSEHSSSLAPVPVIQGIWVAVV
jgi:hypothetical protein